jgi:plastocyanin
MTQRSPDSALSRATGALQPRFPLTLLTALIALGAGLLLATAVQAGTVTAKVLDATGKPVPDVVVVAVSSSHPHKAAALPPQEIIQEDLRFVPAVSVATPGTLVRFSNKDRFDHHVRGTEAQNFELRIAGYDPAKPKASKPGEVLLEGGTGPVQLGCFVHSRMNGSLYITDSPFYGVTGADGSVQIAGVPDGAVKFMVWHPQQLLEQPGVVHTVGAGAQAVTLNLNFTPRRRR